MLKSNEILTLFAILKKAQVNELVSIIDCATDEIVLKKESQLPLCFFDKKKEIKEIQTKLYGE